MGFGQGVAQGLGQGVGLRRLIGCPSCMPERVEMPEWIRTPELILKWVGIPNSARIPGMAHICVGIWVGLEHT